MFSLISKDGYSVHRSPKDFFSCFIYYSVSPPLDHIMSWFASSVQVIVWSWKWNCDVFKLMYCCGDVAALKHSGIINSTNIEKHGFTAPFGMNVCPAPKLASRPVWPLSILTSFPMKWAHSWNNVRPWSEIESGVESVGECKWSLCQVHY